MTGPSHTVAAVTPLLALAEARFISLTTFRRSGEPVSVPVWVGRDGDVLVVLPDEPYAFTPDDGPQAWSQCRPAFVSGRHLTWYGPSLAEAPALLTTQLGG